MPVARRRRPASKAPWRRRPRMPAQQRRFLHRRTAAEVDRCKRGERSDIKVSDWGKCGYADRGQVLSQPIRYDEQTVPIPRVKSSDITPESFFEQFSSRCQPVIVEGAVSHWAATRRWDPTELEKRFRHVLFKVGEDDKGKKLRMKMKYFLDYMAHQRDDNPLYLFETGINDNTIINSLTADYEVPALFPHDWLSLVNSDIRPPYRWFCIGPRRSGTSVHTDPLDTNAWNAVTHGCKRWVLFEPGTPKKVVKGKTVKAKAEDDEAIMYFDFLLPRLKRAHPEVRVYEGMQRAGDLIFVPGGWWHGVLNTEDCIAVTQNYCGPDNFDACWRRTRRDREKLAYLWLRNMRKFAPEMHARAMHLNQLDGFRMRHERRRGERLAGATSSSSDSTDSSSDEARDVRFIGLSDPTRGHEPDDAPPGVPPPAPAAHRGDGRSPRKRPRLDERMADGATGGPCAASGDTGGRGGA